VRFRPFYPATLPTNYLLNALAGFLTLICVSGVSPCYGAEIYAAESLATTNDTPFVQLFGLTRADYKLKLSNKQTRLHSQLSIANYLSAGDKDSTFFYIDGETHIWRNSLYHQLNQDFGITVMIPRIRHSAGFADRFIYDFHDILRLPQNGRRDTHHDRLDWFLRRDGQALARLEENSSGWGDITASLIWFSKPNQQWQAQVKLPQGDFDSQTGSERLDAGISFAGSNPEWLEARAWLSKLPLSVWYGAGLSYIGQNAELSALEPYGWASTARVGMGLAVSDWQLKAQLDTNSPLFDSEIRELGWIPLQITLAAGLQLLHNSELTFAIVEDLRPRVTPDVIFNLGLKHTF